MTRDQLEVLWMKARRTQRRRERRHNRSCTAAHRCYRHQHTVTREELQAHNVREMEK